MRKVYVITCEEWDHSGFGVLRVLACKKKADRDAAMLTRAMVSKKIEVLQTEYDETFSHELSEDSAP